MFFKSVAYAVAAVALADFHPASAVELSKTQQILAEAVVVGCAKMELKRIAPEQRPEFCKCLGEQAALSLTAEDLRTMQSAEQAKEVMSQKAGPAAKLCNALFKK